MSNVRRTRWRRRHSIARCSARSPNWCGPTAAARWRMSVRPRQAHPVPRRTRPGRLRHRPVSGDDPAGQGGAPRPALRGGHDGGPGAARRRPRRAHGLVQHHSPAAGAGARHTGRIRAGAAAGRPAADGISARGGRAGHSAAQSQGGAVVSLVAAPDGGAAAAARIPDRGAAAPGPQAGGGLWCRISDRDPNGGGCAPRTTPSSSAAATTAGRRRLPRPRRALRPGAGAARRTPAARPSPPGPSPAWTPGSRATRTWSACCRDKIVEDLGLAFAVRKRPSPRTRPTVRDGAAASWSAAATAPHRRVLPPADRVRRASSPPGSDFYGMTRPGRRAGLPHPHRAAAHPRASCARIVDDDAAWRVLFEEPIGETSRTASPTTSYAASCSPTP